MTDPLHRHFNPRGPNYPPSGLDTPGRDAERREALEPKPPIFISRFFSGFPITPLVQKHKSFQDAIREAEMEREMYHQQMSEMLRNPNMQMGAGTRAYYQARYDAEQLRRRTFGNEQGAGFDRAVSPASCSPTT